MYKSYFWVFVVSYLDLSAWCFVRLELQTHNSFTRTLFIRTKHNVRIFGLIVLPENLHVVFYANK